MWRTWCSVPIFRIFIELMPTIGMSCLFTVSNMTTLKAWLISLEANVDCDHMISGSIMKDICIFIGKIGCCEMMRMQTQW